MKSATISIRIEVDHSLTAEALADATSCAFSAAERALAGYLPHAGGGYIASVTPAAPK